MTECQVEGCLKPVKSRGWCIKHYTRWLRNGDPLDPGRYPVSRGIRDGRSSHPLYNVYSKMLKRCYRPAEKYYNRYGGRGITVCDRWRNDFWAFVEDMGPRPDGYQIDRINNDGNYEPENCRWTTFTENVRNRNPWSKSMTHCPHGHEYTPENTYRAPDAPNARKCRACMAERSRLRYLRSKGLVEIKGES